LQFIIHFIFVPVSKLSLYFQQLGNGSRELRLSASVYVGKHLVNATSFFLIKQLLKEFDFVLLQLKERLP